MFHPEKNAYLQLVCPMEPRVINKVVQYAMKKKYLALSERNTGFLHDIKLPPAQKLESQHPSLSTPCVDVTQARLGFERIGLTILIRDLNSPRRLVKLQAIHSMMDQMLLQELVRERVGVIENKYTDTNTNRCKVLISESVFFLMEHHVVYRLIDLMLDNEPIVREKVAIILTRLANFYQGRTQIISRPIVVDHLIGMIMQDRKQIRYAASLFLKTLTRYRCACEVIIKNDKIIESLLKMIKHDYMEIVLYHLNSLKNLSEWDPVPPLKANAFQVMKKLLIYTHYRVVQAAMDCLTQLCKQSVGKKLADKYDMNDVLSRFLFSPNIEVIVSTLGLMQYTTTTERSLWRVKQFTYDLVKRLVALAVSQSIPVLQIRAMQVLINLCECSDIRIELKTHWEGVVTNNIKISPNEYFEGTSETTTFGLACGYNYETMCLEDLETIKNDYGDTVQPDDVHSYMSRMIDVKRNLIKAINKRKDKN